MRLYVSLHGCLLQRGRQHMKIILNQKIFHGLVQKVIM